MRLASHGRLVRALRHACASPARRRRGVGDESGLYPNLNLSRPSPQANGRPHTRSLIQNVIRKHSECAK